MNQEICDKYVNDGYSRMKLSREYNLPDSQIKKILTKNGIQFKTRSQATMKYKIDENSFKSIDSPESAYFLGLLYADGGNTGNCISLQLQKSDLNTIKGLRDFLKSDCNIATVKSHSGTEHCKILISNMAVRKNLEKLGIIERKSLVLDFPQENIVSKRFLKFFILGYFDGDGSFFYRKSGKTQGWASLNLVGTRKFLSGVKSFIIEYGLGNCQIVKIKDKRVYRLVMGGAKQSESFMSFLYKNSEHFAMDRKISKFKNFLKLRKEVLSRNKNGTLIEADGEIFCSLKQASIKYNCSPSTINRRCLNDNFPNFKIIKPPSSDN